MVNEINHPKGVSGNRQLNQRLAASTRALQEMQLEHQQLLIEMEMLRQRADELRHLRIVQEMQQQQQQEQQQQQQPQENVVEKDEKAQEEQEGKKAVEQQEIQHTENGGEEQSGPLGRPILENRSTTTLQQTSEKKEIFEKIVQDEETKTVMEDVKKKDSTEANYIQEKLNEIARLKAQYKKVENLINTTQKIEEHLNHKSVTSYKAIEHNINNNTNDTESETKINASTATSTDEKRQLLNAMVGMFEDLSSDLRDQVTNLQDERERIRNLKEELLSKRQQSK